MESEIILLLWRARLYSFEPVPKDKTFLKGHCIIFYVIAWYTQIGRRRHSLTSYLGWFHYARIIIADIIKLR